MTMACKAVELFAFFTCQLNVDAYSGMAIRGCVLDAITKGAIRYGLIYFTHSLSNYIRLDTNQLANPCLDEIVFLLFMLELLIIH